MARFKDKLITPNLIIAGMALLMSVAALIVRLLGSAAVANQILFVGVVITGLPIAAMIAREVTEGKLNVDIIALAAIFGGLIAHQYLAGMIIVLMYAGGNMLEDYALARAARSLRHLIAANPTKANLKRGDKLIEIKATDIKVGDILVVRGGEQVPVDGVIVAGASNFDEASLTGEPVPQRHTVGDIILSAIVNTDSTITMRATQTAQTSTFARIVELVEVAQAKKAPIHRLADIYGMWFTPFVVIFTTLTWFITHNGTTTYAVLVVATPCPLLIATPVAIISGIGRAARRGIIVKEGAALEKGARIDTIVFDKTGTLTNGAPDLDHIIAFGDYTEHELLRLASSLEYHSGHPLARAILRAAASRVVRYDAVDRIDEHDGRAVSGKVDDRLSVIVGSLDTLVDDHHIKINQSAKRLIGGHQYNDKLIAGIAVDGKIAGFFVFGDPIKHSVPRVLQRLRWLGIKRQIVLSGDEPARVKALADTVHLDPKDARGGLLPEAKLAQIRALEQTGARVAMVGDGTNDAPSLAAADLAIALGSHGSAVSSETADVVIADDQLTKVADYFVISQDSLRIALQSIWIGMSLSLVAMIVAAMGLLAPVRGAILQEAIDVSVILNALRVLVIKF